MFLSTPASSLSVKANQINLFYLFLFFFVKKKAIYSFENNAWGCSAAHISCLVLLFNPYYSFMQCCADLLQN